MEERGIFEKLDVDQRAAVGLRANATVSAGAGSGKTTVLAARYLDLVFSEGADARSILCLTFTRKAAAEMRARIYRELASSDDPRARAQVERFSEASISTIDSFCGSVLRSSAQDYGYAPNFAVDNDKARSLAERGALSFLLARREDAPLSELFSLLGFEAAWRGLFAEAAFRFASPAPRREGDFRSMPARAAAATIAAAHRAVSEITDAARAALDEAGATTARAKTTLAIFAALPDFDESPPLAAFPVGASSAAGAEANVDSSAKDFLAFSVALREVADAVRPLAVASLQHFGKSDAEKGIAAAASAGREAARRLAALARAAERAPLCDAVSLLLADFADEFRDSKRKAGVMSFRDVAVAAVDLLASRPELRAYWKRRYRYIMVDEFQDDDELQKELLFLLAEASPRMAVGLPSPSELEPDKLFFVGDDKQSIYKFRGADVAVFNRLGRELGSPGPRLRMNYRSEPAMVGFYNELFARVFAGASCDFEARFEDSGRRLPGAGLDPSVSLLWKAREANSRADGEGEATRGSDEALAFGVVEWIRRAVEGRSLMIPDEGGGRRPARYDDIAILLRSGGKQYLLERFLRLRGLPYAAADLRGLFVESPANDMYAALKLATAPEDRLAYATLLRSPLVRVSDDGFVRLLSSDLSAFDPRGAELLDTDDQTRYARGIDLFSALSDRADRAPIAELVDELWYSRGLRLSILRRPDAHPYLEHYDYLFSLASASDAQGESLATFLSRIEPLLGKPERLDDVEVQREAGSGIRIMTIHKSKGLEFPVVVLPWIEGKSRSDGAGEAFYVSEEAGITLNLRSLDEPKASRENPFYEAARELESDKTIAETKRLLYVACTRAIAHIVFAACEPRGEDKRGASFLGLLAGGGGVRRPDGGFEALPAAVRLVELPELAEEAYGRLFGGRGPRRAEDLAPAYEAARALDRRYARRSLPATALNSAALLESTIAPSSLETVFPETAWDVLAASEKGDGEDAETLFGTLCHAALESRVLGRPFRPDDGLLAPLSRAARAAALAEAERLAEGFSASELGKLVLGAPRRRAECGYVLALPAGGCPNGTHYAIHCRADLVAETRDEIHVVDFKSSRARRAGEYDVQLALYRRAAAGAAPGKRVRTWVFWLRGALAEEREAEFGDERLVELAERASESK